MSSDRTPATPDTPDTRRDQDAADIARAGVHAESAGTRSLASRERLYQAPTEFGPYRIFRDHGTWAIYTPEEPIPGTAPVLPAVRTPLDSALVQVARRVLARRAEAQGPSDAAAP